jgi:hypothetical protein
MEEIAQSLMDEDLSAQWRVCRSRGRFKPETGVAEISLDLSFGGGLVRPLLTQL